MLLSWCESENPQDLAACTGYLVGIGDILDSQTVFEGRACIAKTLTSDDLRKLFILFLRVNPEMAEKTSGANIAALALIEAYPCPSKGKGI